jgi:regulator of sigma E protease
MCIIAALDPDALASWLLVILQVIAGLGFVIFVHELGHFAVAKACGVKCPKFYLGFDVPFGLMLNKLLRREGEFSLFGLKIPRTIGRPIQIGETEYGIGILPLGGYVRMLGQDDDPANISEQLRESQVSGNTVDAKEITGPDGKAYLVDKRSYLAKSVPQRMAIISAGVIMNVIFAFIFATIAYKIGVPYNPSIVSATAPGSPAWKANLRPGDEVVQVGDIKNPSFADLKGSVTLGDLENGMEFVIKRGSEQITKTLTPEQGTGLARVGIAPPNSLRLHPQKAAFDWSPAASATARLEPGDEVVAVNGKPVASYAELSALFTQSPDKPLTIQVRRGAKAPDHDAQGPRTGGEFVDVTVAPAPMKTLGLVMQMGKIVAVQDNSPAAEAKLQPGDFIDRISEASDAAEADLARDPMTLPEDLRRMAEENREVRIKLRPGSAGADGKQSASEHVLALRKVDWQEEAIAPNDPVAVPALGLSYRVLSVVDRVVPDSPAAKAGMKDDDVVLKAEFVFPKDLKEKPEPLAIEFSQNEGDEQANWPRLMAALQFLPEGTQVKLTYKRGSDTKEALLTPVATEGYYLADRGLIFDWISETRIAKTWGEAVERGWHETVNSLGMVYRFLNKLGTGQVPVTALGGPVTIAQAAGFSAFEGLGKLLVFLTMLSANLAVINFLPIPLLDGGHMVFLAWEGLRGKPAGERFVVAMHMIGFAFIITLMVFVISLDIGLIERNL